MHPVKVPLLMRSSVERIQISECGKRFGVHNMHDSTDKEEMLRECCGVLTTQISQHSHRQSSAGYVSGDLTQKNERRKQGSPIKLVLNDHPFRKRGCCWSAKARVFGG